MPPKKEKQPAAKERAAVLDWITEQTVRAELARRDRTVILRRLNRDEYHNTIRDIIGLDFDISGFPQDPLAGGFDNNGGALTMSPLQLEMYIGGAANPRSGLGGRRAAEEDSMAIRTEGRLLGPHPQAARLEKQRHRQRRQQQTGRHWVVIHRNSWDKQVGARDFRVPVAGNYIIRVKAAGRVPDRAEVVKSAEAILAAWRNEQMQKNPKGAKYHDEAFAKDLEHFRTDRIYSYGPPRIKLVQQLGPQPRTLAEFDADGTEEKPKVHEFTARFTTESAGVSFEYAYNIPSVLENFWMQGRDDLRDPEVRIEWFEIEGPVYDAWPPGTHTSILFESPLRETDERQYASEVLSRFMRKAYRRPASDVELAAKMKLFDQAKAEGAAFLDAVKRPLIAVLVSPNFLFLAEPAGEVANEPRTLTDHELAARLSYFLWSSTPDAELAKLADDGKLKDKAERLRQIERMLAESEERSLRSELRQPMARHPRCRQQSAGSGSVPEVRPPLRNVDRRRERGVLPRSAESQPQHVQSSCSRISSSSTNGSPASTASTA